MTHWKAELKQITAALKVPLACWERKQEYPLSLLSMHSSVEAQTSMKESLLGLIKTRGHSSSILSSLLNQFTCINKTIVCLIVSLQWYTLCVLLIVQVEAPGTLDLSNFQL